MKTVTADHEAGCWHRMEDSLLQKSKERKTSVTRMKQKREGTEAREEGSLIELNRNE